MASILSAAGTRFNKAIKNMKFLRREIIANIKEKKTRLEKAENPTSKDMMTYLLVTASENGKFMSEEDIANNIIGLLIAGHDTASTTITFTIKYLAELPHVYQEICWGVHSTHKDLTYFPNPEKFDTTRFDGIGPAPYTYVPFGGGPRMCPGKEYARLEMLVFIYNLVKKFHWKKLIPNERIVFKLTPYLENGFPIRLTPHETTSTE